MLLKEFKIKKDSFISGWIIPQNICDDIIKYFNDNKEKAIDGTINYKLLKKEKKSKEIIFSSDYNEYPLKDYKVYLQKVLELYLKKYVYANNVNFFNIIDNIKIQYYKKNEGFKSWHFERTGVNHSIKRHLVFMTYLNDVNDGGTDFYYQKIITPAKKGLTLIWPVDWTHTHRGQISKNEEKYIITGWYSFN